MARILAAVAVCFVLLGLFALASLYFLLQGTTAENSIVVSQLEANIEKTLGPDFDVVIQDVDLDLSQWSKAGFKTVDVVIKRHSDNSVLATLGAVSAGATLTDVFRGKVKLNTIEIDNVVLDLGAFGADRNVLLPPHLDKPLNALAVTLAGLNDQLNENDFQKIVINNMRLDGARFGRLEDGPVLVPLLELHRSETGELRLDGEVEATPSKVALKSVYKTASDGSASYSFDMSGIDLREWFRSPDGDEGVIALNSTVDVSGNLPFTAERVPQDPNFSIKAGPGDMRVGLNAVTSVQSAQFNFRVFLDRNQIELDSSPVSIGRFNGSLIGGLKPAIDDVGYAGPLRYDFIIERGTFAPTLDNERVLPGAFQITGVFDRDKKQVGVKKVLVSTADGSAIGSGMIDLSGETPSVRGTMKTDGISVLAVKQYWPYFVAGKARKWIHEHIIDGRVASGTVEMDIPAGILFRMKDGAKLKPEHYKTVLNLENFSFRPFGDMPAIEEAAGTVKLEGMKISANLDKGKASDQKGKSVKILEGSFVMNDFAAGDRVGETTLELDGEIRAIARIAEREPLKVMSRMKVSPEQFSGAGHANIVARFPVGRKASYTDIDWNVLLEMRDGSSSKPLAGRKLSKADLVIDANPTGAAVNGKASLDGVSTRLQLTEPIGKSGKVSRKRTITATLSEKDRLRLGFDLNPVVNGPVGIRINQENGREFHTLDFTEAEIALPWVGWRKGKGISASGSFELKRSGEKFLLNKFELKGDGFGGSGKMVLNRKGLLSADLTRLKLNRTDDMSLRIEREDNVYNINAAGLSFDGRGVMNTLIHSGGFSKAKGDKSVNLVANFETVRGFNNRIIKNAILLYETRDGRLRKLDMTARGSDGRRYSVQAQLNGNDTLFTMGSNDAGTALAFTDIYTRMQGGELTANLLQAEVGPFIGPVRIVGFEVVNEPRIARMASNVNQMPNDRDDVRKVIPDGADKIVKFQLAQAQIERATGYMNLREAVIRSGTMGITMNGQLYDENDRMNLNGTFMPANGVNMAVSAIPLLGQLFSNGRDNALIGITYRLSGSRKNPKLEVNPLSIVTPGVFNKVFEFK